MHLLVRCSDTAAVKRANFAFPLDDETAVLFLVKLGGSCPAQLAISAIVSFGPLLVRSLRQDDIRG